MKFIKKQITIDAVQYINTDSIPKINDFLKEGNAAVYKWQNLLLTIRTSEGYLNIVVGDWIIRDANNEYSCYEPDAFKKTYEPVSDMELCIRHTNKWI